MSTRSFREIFAQPRQTDSYWEKRAALDFTESVYQRMTALGLTKSQLAERLGTSPAYVTKILGGEANFTLKTMVRLARALEVELAVHLVPGEETVAKGAEEETSAVAENGRVGRAYGRVRKRRARG
jgi:transcriptional regulator with XRE-family HTH domain